MVIENLRFAEEHFETAKRSFECNGDRLSQLMQYPPLRLIPRLVGKRIPKEQAIREIDYLQKGLAIRAHHFEHAAKDRECERKRFASRLKPNKS